jgi:hypothetical protein
VCGYVYVSGSKILQPVYGIEQLCRAIALEWLKHFKGERLAVFIVYKVYNLHLLSLFMPACTLKVCKDTQNMASDKDILAKMPTKSGY